MKSLCVFYKNAADWQGKEVKWIVCQSCQRQIKRGAPLILSRLLVKALEQSFREQK